MDKDRSYTGIDSFRFFAALLIIAIHTSPLAAVNSTGDFILTRVAARVAVPFFFMTSGFFLISHYAKDAGRLIRFVKHTGFIYGASILFYVPVNIYNGYFKMENLAPNIVKDIVFDGTLYHLWYLPAAAAGASVAWYLVRRWDYPKAVMAAVLLYVIGLFGDSYYGIAEMWAGTRSMYDFLFQLTDHTRNGVFFAPVFFVLGGFMAEQRRKPDLVASFRGFSISFALMLGEALILRYLGLQRHDSMYVFLLPCMYFLFRVILHFRGKRLVRLRTVSLLIYIIHPMIIVLVRLSAKTFHLQSLLVDNGLVHYVIVCALSVGCSAAAVWVWEKYLPHRNNRKSPVGKDRTYVEINLKNLEHNARELKRVMPPRCRLMAVVKADAYGHGAFEISTHLEKMGVRAFAAATIDEAIRLRKYGVRGEILILGYTDVCRAAELKKYDLIQTLIDFSYAEALNRQGIAVKAHIKIDTGMHRLGEPAEDIARVKKMFCMKNLNLCGIFTHLCCADRLNVEEVTFTQKQIECFYELLASLEMEGIRIPKVHVQSSYGLLNYPELSCDYVRAGIALYGVLSSPEDADATMLHLDLHPVLSLKSRVVLVRSVKKGEYVGYGREFRAERDSRIAILPVGYGDGFPRNLSCGNGNVMINQCRVPVIGRICMDQLAIDITDAGDIEVGDEAVLIGGDDAGGLSAPAIAGRSGSITNELLSRMGTRVKVS